MSEPSEMSQPSPINPAYENALVHVITTIIAAQGRGGRWLDEAATGPHDLAWRTAAQAEFASWLGLLALLPTEVPPPYAQVQARLVRWAGAVATAGDRYARLIATGDRRQARAARRRMEALPDLYRAMQEALIEVHEVHSDR